MWKHRGAAFDSFKRHINIDERSVVREFFTLLSAAVFFFSLSRETFPFFVPVSGKIVHFFYILLFQGDRLSVVSSVYYFLIRFSGFILLFSEMLQLEFSFFLIYFPLMTLLWYPFFSRCINTHLPIHTLKHHGRKTQWSSQKKNTHTYDTPTQTPWKIINLILIKCRF